MKRLLLCTVVLGSLFGTQAIAYVGPGVGLGVFGTLFGLFAAVALALFGLFWYPLKRAFSKKSTSITDDLHGDSEQANNGDPQ